LHALASASVSGPVNVVSPEPVTNAEFTRILARVLGRPALLSVPAFVLRFAFGELADETLLSSQRAAPARLLATGFRFREAGLEGALRCLLGREIEGTAGRGAQAAA
jgi:NAD dependent epimerase/dehydratase family enzyme